MRSGSVKLLILNPNLACCNLYSWDTRQRSQENLFLLTVAQKVIQKLQAAVKLFDR